MTVPQAAPKAIELPVQFVTADDTRSNQPPIPRALRIAVLTPAFASHTAYRFPLPASRCPLPASRFPRPGSRFPLPDLGPRTSHLAPRASDLDMITRWPGPP